MKKLFLWFGIVAVLIAALALAVPALPQNPQSSTAPLYAVNAKYSNGVAPGYWPTQLSIPNGTGGTIAAATGLNVNIGPGTANCGSGNIVTYVGGTKLLTASATNRVYLDTTSSCAVSVKTTAFASTDIPLAVIVTNGTGITTNGLTDVRTPFTVPPVGSGFTAAGDLSGSSSSQTVIGIQGHTLPTLAAGYPHWTGSAWVYDTPSGGGGVQYPTVPAVLTLGDSLYVVAQAPTQTANGVNCDGTDCTLTFASAHGYVAGDWIQIFPQTVAFSPSCLNWAAAQVESSGLTSTQLKISESQASIPTYTGCTGVQTGTGGQIMNWNYSAAVQTIQGPFFSAGGTSVPLLFPAAIPGDTPTNEDANFSTRYSTFLAAHPGTWVVMNVSSNDMCSVSAATEQAKLQSIWTKIHAAGAYVMVNTMTNGFGHGCGISGSPDSVIAAVTTWLGAQTKKQITSGTAYIDVLSDAGQIVNDSADNSNQYYVQQSTDVNPGHWTRAGSWAVAHENNRAMQTGGSFYGNLPNLYYNYYHGNQVAPGWSFGAQSFQSVNGVGEIAYGYYVYKNTGWNWLGWLHNAFNCYQNGSGGGYGPYLGASDACISRGTHLPHAYAFGSGGSGSPNPGDSDGGIEVKDIYPNLASNPTIGTACSPDGTWEFAQNGTASYCNPSTHQWAYFSGTNATNFNVCGDTSGSGTAQSCTASPLLSALVANQTCIVYTTTTANTGTNLTVNVSALGAKFVAIPGSSGWTTTLTAGILPANKPIPMCYDGTNFDVIQTGTQASGGGLTGGALGSVPYKTDSSSGYTYVNSPTTAQKYSFMGWYPGLSTPTVARSSTCTSPCSFTAFATGDMVLVWDFNNTNAADITSPASDTAGYSGWTLLGHAKNGTFMATAISSATITTTATTTISGGYSGDLLVIVEVAGTSGVDLIGPEGYNSGGGSVSTSITTTGASELMIGLGAYEYGNTNITSTTAGWTFVNGIQGSGTNIPDYTTLSTGNTFRPSYAFSQSASTAGSYTFSTSNNNTANNRNFQIWIVAFKAGTTSSAVAPQAYDFLTSMSTIETVPFSTTPTFSNSTAVSRIVLTGNITSFTLAAGIGGQQKTLCFVQDATGSRTVAGPSNVKGLFTIGTTASKSNCQHFIYDNVLSAWYADSAGVTNQ